MDIYSNEYTIMKTSSIKVMKNNDETTHREITDAMENAINGLATQPVAKFAIVVEATVIKRTA